MKLHTKAYLPTINVCIEPWLMLSTYKIFYSQMSVLISINKGSSCYQGITESFDFQQLLHNYLITI